MVKGQSTIELLVIVAVALVILAVLVGYTSQQVTYLQKQRAIKTGELAIQNIINTSNELYTQGAGASRYLQLTWPDGVDAGGTFIQDRTIVVSVYGTQISGTADQPLTGSLPTNSGMQYVRIRAFDGFVAIGETGVSATPSFVLSSLSRDTNSSTPVVLTNLTSDDATLTFSTTWAHTDVNVVLNASSGTLAAGNTFPFDVNFLAGSSSVGTYTGRVSIQAVFPSRVETVVVPIQANVNVGNQSPLVAFPSTISLSTFGIDTNSTTFQLCNVGTTDLKTISITPSTGAPGTWIQGYATIPSLTAQTCQTIDVNVVVPTDSIADYTASLFISDYTGANTLTIPTTISVLGMGSFFYWDWTPAIKSVQSIFDFTLTNAARKPITLSQVKVYNWTKCDLQQSLWNSLVVDGTARFIGSLPDGNIADITDFNIPVLTSYSDNSLSFSDNISDDSETFIVLVDFSDGTQYTSSTFGTPCAPDTTAPARVSDLRLVPGPEPESMIMSFTFPGDDGNSGRITDINMRVSNTVIDSQAAFDAATVLNYGGGIPFPVGGTTYSQTLSNYDVGYYWFVSVQSVDENGNRSAISNSPVSKPWDQFRFTGNDFNFANFAPNTNAIGQPDVNKFLLHSFVLPAASYRQLVVSVSDDTDLNHSWIVALDMNSTHVTNAVIWYQTNPLTDFWSAAPDYNGVESIPLSGGINMFDNSYLTTPYKYAGSQVFLSTPLTFRVHTTTNITDFNLTFDILEVGAAIPAP